MRHFGTSCLLNSRRAPCKTWHPNCYKVPDRGQLLFRSSPEIKSRRVHLDWHHPFMPKDATLVSFEDQAPRPEQGPIGAVVGGVSRVSEVLIVRSIYNVAASRQQHEGRSSGWKSNTVDLWCSHASAALTHPCPVLFDNWNDDNGHRRSIETMLELPVTDCGLYDVGPWGGGSSFTGTRVPVNRVVNLRWQRAVMPPELLASGRAAALNQALFGWHLNEKGELKK